MIDYIIIDNDIKNRKKYKEVIECLMFNKNIIYQIKEYNQNKFDINNITSNNYKIYLIDISEETIYYGINIAKKIREQDPNSEIIFLGSLDIIFEPIFKSVRKIYCVIDKISTIKDRLREELNIIINNYLVINSFFPLDKKGNIQICQDDILYIYRETTERKLYIVTNRDKYPINMNLKEAIELCNEHLKQVHRACIVNTLKVSLYNWNENYFVLKNGTKVFMCSKNYKKNINC